MKYIIETKSDKVLIEAKDRDHAFAKYFYDIICGKTPIEKVGALIMLKQDEDEGNDIPMRTVPLLWKMGFIGTKRAVDITHEIVGGTRKGAKNMLRELADKDARLVPLIDDLKLEEEKE